MYTLSLLAKPTGTFIPFVLIIIDWWPYKRLSIKSLVEKIPFFVVGGISAIITYISQKNAAGVGIPTDSFGLSERFLRLIYCILFYPYKMIFPVNNSSHYAIPSDMTLNNPKLVFSIIATMVIIGLLIYSLKFTKSLMAGFLMFNITIFPTIGFISFTNTIASDKYAYIPAIGYLIAVCGFANQINTQYLKKVSKNIVLTVSLIMLTLATVVTSYMTQNYTKKWLTSQSLYMYMSSKTPDVPSINEELARLFMKEKQNDKALYYAELAIKSKNNNFSKSTSYNTYGAVLLEMGKLDHSKEAFEKAINQKNPDPQAFSNMGKVYSLQGELDKGLEYFYKAMEYSPNSSSTNYNVGYSYFVKKDYNKAIKFFDKTIKLKYEDPEVFLVMALCLAYENRINESEVYAQKWLGIVGHSVKSYNTISYIYAEAGINIKAEEYQQKAKQFNVK
jgi:tetratricopeptide (TPR) repeat protein